MKTLFPKLIRLAVFLLLAALLIPLGNTFLVQLDTFATVMMQEIKSRDDIELALIGSSVVQHHFNAPLISEATGLTAFDATITNAFLPDDLALTRQLYETNSPEWVVLVLEAYSFNWIRTDPQSQLKLMPHLTSPLGRLRYYRDIMETDGDTLGRLLLFNTFGFSSFDDVKKAVRLRTDPEGCLAQLIAESDGQYAYEDGFVRRESTERAMDGLVKTVIREQSDYEYRVYDYTKEKLLEYKALVESHGSNLLVVLAPGMTAHALAEPWYLAYLDDAQAFFEAIGVPCINLMLAKPELLPNLDEYYFDLYHMVGEGADQLSAAFARVFNALRAGEDVSCLFYRDSAEYLASIDFITNVWMTQEQSGDSVTLHADCNRGAQVAPEYRFTLRGADGSETLLRDYDAEPAFSCDASLLSGGTPRVYARVQEETDAVFFDPGDEECALP